MPRKSLRREGATGFVKCMSKPAAFARARSSFVPQPDTAAIAEVLRLLDQADAALRSGDFARYGELQRQARERLRRLAQ